MVSPRRDAPAHGGQIRPILILSHFGLAATGLVLWIVYVANGSDALAWIAFVILVLVALLGLDDVRDLVPAAAGSGRGDSAPAATTGVPAEQSFPVAIVTLHGIGAVTTVVLVFLASIGV